MISICISGLALHAAADGVQRIERIDVEGHYDNRIGTSDAASAGVIGPQLIEDRPLLRAGEVLEYIPGMVVTQHSGAGKANQYFLRGFNLDHGTDFATTIAGMPVNMRTHAHGQGWTDLNFMIPELVSRIDYFKGPYYASLGDFATAGAANIHYFERVKQGVAELIVGSDRYGRALLLDSAKVGSGDLLYAVEIGRSNGPWDKPDDYRKYNGVLRYTQATAEGKWNLTAMGYSGRWNSTDQIPRRAVEDGRIGRFGLVDPTDGGRSHRYSLSADYQTRFAGGVLQTTAYAIRSDLDLYSNFTYFLDRPEDGDQFNQEEKRRLNGWNGSWTHIDDFSGKRMQHTLGWDLRQDRLGPVALHDSVARQRTATTREDRVRETSLALYFENQTQWSDWLRTLAGVRGDRYQFKVDSNLAENSGSRTASLASPKLSVILGPWSQTEFFINAGRGFHSNDARGTTANIDPKTGDAIDPVTPLVRTKGAELGLRTEIVPNLQSSIALWHLKFDSELVFVGDAGTTEAGRPSKRSGIEWSNRYTPRPWLLMELDLAWTRARFADEDPAGNRIPNALNVVAAGGITLRDLGPWSASLFGRYFGPRPLIEDNSVKSGSTTLFNTQATYKVSKQLRVRLDVFNIFDRKADDITYFYASRLPGEPAGGVDDVHFHPVERRSMRVGVVYNF